MNRTSKSGDAQRPPFLDPTSPCFLQEARRVFAKLGVFELPRTFAELDEALGLPAGESERAGRAMFGGTPRP